MNQHKWQIGPVKLANGEEALIDAINEGQDGNRYTGRVKGIFGDWIPVGWNTDGRKMYAEADNPYNLAPPPKKTVRVQRWMAVYPSGSTETFLCKAEAIMEVNKFGFALIEIDREVEEGDGLS
jgi:hypothetical protein